MVMLSLSITWLAAITWGRRRKARWVSYGEMGGAHLGLASVTLVRVQLSPMVTLSHR